MERIKLLLEENATHTFVDQIHLLDTLAGRKKNTHAPRKRKRQRIPLVGCPLPLQITVLPLFFPLLHLRMDSCTFRL